MPSPRQPRPKCSGKAKVKDADGNVVLGEDGKPLLRPCRKFPNAGSTKCRMHGASAKQVKAAAAVRAEVMKWGLGDTKVDPGEMLLRLLSQSAARANRYAAELEELISEAEAEGKPLREALIRQAYGEFGVTGEFVRGLVEHELKERTFCRDTAVKAVAAGLAERQVRLAERQGEMLVELIEAALHGAGVTGDAYIAGRKAAAERLRLIEGGVS